MSHPRRGLTRNLGATKLDLSFRKNRLGFTFRSTRELYELRGPYFRRQLRRVQCLHQASGRYFAQPSGVYLKQALLSLDAELALESPGCREFLCPQRSDRIRRLGSVAQFSRSVSASPLLERMALRLESLPEGHRPDKLWSGLADDFDEVWKSVRLYTCGLSSLDRLVFGFLEQLRLARVRSLKNRDENAPMWA